MKSRSHRLPITVPPDDWVDESWTVDCVCGVNFDDGEEMVNCDECGVWVHTRCSRYVKSEKLFACDKCKSKKNRNDSEETEVAQLLVELPTKTVKMDNPCPVTGPSRRPFRLWTEIPMEEKVHVQGIPGGDPALFGGLSSVFNPELWKCSGYVPKKFNFQYREFPCWDEKQEDGKKGVEETENPANKGAGVLFSLSKENVLPGPLATLGYMKTQVDGGAYDSLAPSMDAKKQEIEDSDVKRLENGLKKERSLLKPIVFHSGKRKKEDLGTSKDLSGKKKARVVDKERDSKKRAAHSSKSVSTNSSDAKPLELYEGRVHKVVKTNALSSKSGNPRDNERTHPLSDGSLVVDNDVGKSNNDRSCSGQPQEMLSFDVPKHKTPIEARSVEVNDGHHVPLRIEISHQPNDAVALSLEANDMEVIPMKHEVVLGDAANIVNTDGTCPSRSEGTKPLGEDMAAPAPAPATAIKDSQHFQDSNGDISLSSLQQPNFDVKSEVELDNSREASKAKSSPASDVKLDNSKPSAQHLGVSADPSTKKVEVNDAAIAGSQSSDQNMQDINKNMVVVCCQANKAADESPSEPCESKLLAGSESLVVCKSSSEFKHGPGPVERPSKSSGTVVSTSQRKMVVSVGKSSSSSSTIKISKPSISGKGTSAIAENHTSSAKQKGTSDYHVSVKKNNASADVAKDGDGIERPKKIAKELPKASVASVQKTSHSSKFSHAPVPKRTLSDSKDPVIQSSSKTSSLQNAAATSDSGESGSLQVESVQHVQNKIATSGLPVKSDKINQSIGQPASKVNQMQPVHPPVTTNSPATLSDEELALLLHQELNSSPRVPRVPRMRHAGSLPQLASPTATSVLMKRTSSSGGKDHGLASRRKNKDLTKDGSHISREHDDEAKKVDRVPLPSQRRHDSAENGSAKGYHPVDKSLPPASTSLSSGPSSSTEANEQNMSSSRNSTQNASDDTGTVGRATPRTLPGLLAEIMSKGKRMAYEELCNAVLPHWPNLRKQNGERYAYSSHSQAVLDCLRNRSEWARLVDRGPKTNASRKRRKPDADNCESEDNEYSKDRNTKDLESKSFEARREEFPKGKRKARKRRRLALQGRGIKDVRRRRKADVVSDDDDDDDDVCSSSNSSEESMFSDDEIQGGGTCPVVSEASASSDEAGAMS